MDPLLRDIMYDNPTASDDDEQPDSNEDSPSLSASITSPEPSNRLNRDSSITPKRPMPRAFRHRKIVKTKSNPTTSESLLSELKKTNATLLTLQKKSKERKKRMRNVEKKVKRSNNNSGSSSNSSSPSNFKKTVPIGIRVRLANYICIYIAMFTEGNQTNLQAAPGRRFRKFSRMEN